MYVSGREAGNSRAPEMPVREMGAGRRGGAASATEDDGRSGCPGESREGASQERGTLMVRMLG